MGGIGPSSLGPLSSTATRHPLPSDMIEGGTLAGLECPLPLARGSGGPAGLGPPLP
jgi:hypothetical protein